MERQEFSPRCRRIWRVCNVPRSWHGRKRQTTVQMGKGYLARRARRNRRSYILGTPLGIIKCRDFKRIAMKEERWNFEFLQTINGTPWAPVPGQVSDAIPVRVHMPEEGTPPRDADNIPCDPPKNIKRRARITRDDIIKVGYTHRCPGCVAISRNAPAQNHTEECRRRVEDALLREGGVRAKLIRIGLERYEQNKKSAK